MLYFVSEHIGMLQFSNMFAVVKHFGTLPGPSKLLQKLLSRCFPLHEYKLFKILLDIVWSATVFQFTHVFPEIDRFPSPTS